MMPTLIPISEVVVISIDRNEDSWAIEGEITFDEDLNTAFEVTYLPDEDTLDDLSLEITPGHFDKSELKRMIIEATMDFE